MTKQRWIWLIAILLIFMGGLLLYNTIQSPALLLSLPYHLLIIAIMFGVWASFEWRKNHKKLAYLFIALAVYSLTAFAFTTMVL
ncbi:hypothetical protein [Alteribacter keqinensis]|uniref:Uncharacterized protein n=1 Tax=Alteribacter keqinensis TaxID=2483800 RepID=A0A3M7TTC1_9BACI|nr:hypothetical protein [Alteribacter keqinensis]RNA68529.1 hypothetical protein EBO34_00715 [Alteribacter keqinensis]